MSREKKTPKPAWIRCQFCDEWWCLLHDAHVADCDCPPVEEWMTDPYTGEGPGPAALLTNDTPSGTMEK